MAAETFAWRRAFIRPDPVVFASLFALDSMARVMVTPLQVFAVLGSAIGSSICAWLTHWIPRSM